MTRMRPWRQHVHYLAISLEKRKLLFLFLFSVLYFLATWLRSSAKLLWYDELFTLYIARLPSLADIAAALRDGVDLNPPLYYLLARLALAVVEPVELALRLPSVLGFWVMCLCMFRFVERRTSTAHGFIALLFPLVTNAYSYAFEARPYGLLLGCAGLSILFWADAAQENRTAGSLSGLVLALSAALLSHFYGIFLFLPLLVGQLIRTYYTKTVDWVMWLCLVAPVFLTAFWTYQLPALRANKHLFWARAEWPDLFWSYLSLLGFSVLLLAAIACFCLFFGNATSSTISSARFAIRSLPVFSELAAAVTLALLPIFGVIFGKLITGVFHSRYVLPSVAGIGIVVAFSCYYRIPTTDWRPVLVTLGIVGWFCTSTVVFVRNQQTEYGHLQARPLDALTPHRLLRCADGDSLPIAISDARMFLRLWHYAPLESRSRFVYLIDRASALRYTKADTQDRALEALSRYAPIPIAKYGDFASENRSFWAYGPRGLGFDWLFFKLKDDGADLQMERCGEDGGQLFVLSKVSSPRR